MYNMCVRKEIEVTKRLLRCEPCCIVAWPALWLINRASLGACAYDHKRLAIQTVSETISSDREK